MASVKLRFLGDGWRENTYDDRGYRTGFKRHRKNDVVEVDADQKDRLLSLNRQGKHLFEEYKATEEEKSQPQAPATRTPAPSGDKKG